MPCTYRGRQTGGSVLEGYDALLAVAEVAVGITGFAGIVAALRRDPGRWSAVELYRLFSLLVSSVGTLILSLLPVGLYFSGLDGIALWRVSSTFLWIYCTVFMLATLNRHRRAEPGALQELNPYLLVFLWGCAILAWAATMLNVIGWPLTPRFSIYFFVLLWFLFLAAYQFARTILWRRKQD